MINYETASDFEVNKKLANLMNVKWSCSPSASPNGQWLFTNKYKEIEGESTPLPDYCNNWSDIGPLIESYLIELEYLDGFGWTASAAPNQDCASSCYDNPKRAAAICIIKLLESKQ